MAADISLKKLHKSYIKEWMVQADPVKEPSMVKK